VTDLELPDDHRVFSFGLLTGVTLADGRMLVFQRPDNADIARVEVTAAADVRNNSRHRLTYGVALKESTTCHLKGV